VKHTIGAGVLFVGLLAAASARAQSLEVLGYSGMLGEWELTANVVRGGETNSYSGALLMRHVGICSQDGPEEKSGSIRLQLSQAMLSSPPPPRLSATLHVDGIACTFSGKLLDSYEGTLNCPDRVPVPLQIWLKSIE